MARPWCVSAWRTCRECVAPDRSRGPQRNAPMRISVCSLPIKINTALHVNSSHQRVFCPFLSYWVQRSHCQSTAPLPSLWLIRACRCLPSHRYSTRWEKMCPGLRNTTRRDRRSATTTSNAVRTTTRLGEEAQASLVLEDAHVFEHHRRAAALAAIDASCYRAAAELFVPSGLATRPASNLPSNRARLQRPGFLN